MSDSECGSFDDIPLEPAESPSWRPAQEEDVWGEGRDDLGVAPDIELCPPDNAPTTSGQIVPQPPLATPPEPSDEIPPRGRRIRVETEVRSYLLQVQRNTYFTYDQY